MAELDRVTPPSSQDDCYDPLNDEPYAKRRMYSSEVLDMWNLVKIFCELGTREKCIAFAEAQGLIRATKDCRVHRKPMCVFYSVNNNVGAFKCSRGSCRTSPFVSRSKGTFFENIKIDMPHVFYLMYCFSHHWSYNQAVYEDCFRNGHCLSHRTIRDWYAYCREIIVSYVLDKQEYVGKIGGPGKIVQIDESKFGKRKSNKGTRVEGKWVIGIREKNSNDLRLEVCSDNSMAALLPLVQKHVNEGSIIHTDNQKAYDCLAENGFTHVVKDDTHIQKTESQWQAVKIFFSIKNHSSQSDFSNLIVEYVWRCEIVRNKRDPFLELIKAVKYVFDKK